MNEIRIENKSKVSLEWLLIGAAFLFGLSIRLLHLAQAPLTDAESTLALQALRVAQGGFKGLLAGQPGYILPTGLLFAIFGAGNAAARLIPALAGSAIIFLPGFFRKELGNWAAVLLAFGLALDPGLTALSRQANSVTWAVLFGVLTLTGLTNKKPVLAGISLGLAVLGGAQFWQGLLAGGLAFLLVSVFGRRKAQTIVDADQVEPVSQRLSWKKMALWSIGSFLLGGSLFLFVPKGISAAASGLVDFLSSWLHAGGESLSILALAVGVYELFALIFGIAQVIRVIAAHEKPFVDLGLIAWWFIALLVAFINPSRNQAGLVWAMVPMWGLAVRWLAAVIVPKKINQPLFTAILAIILFILGVLFVLDVVGLLDLNQTQEAMQLHWISAAGALVLFVAAIVLVRWGWSGQVAGLALAWAFTGLLAIWGISQMVSAAGLGRHPETQLWRTGPDLIEEDLLMNSIGDASLWNSGFKDDLDLYVVNVTSPALQWALRDYLAVDFFDVNPVGSMPDMVVTPEQASPELAQTYRGQDFTWRAGPAWSAMTTNDLLKWIFFKNAPLDSEKILLWVRADRFPGASSTP